MHIPQLDRKLRCLFLNSKKIKSRLDFASHFGVGEKAIAAWIYDPKTEVSDTIPDKHKDALCELLTEFGIPINQSLRIWTGPLHLFQYSILISQYGDFLNVVRGNSENLEISYYLRNPKALGMLQSLILVPSNSIQLNPGWEISFDISVKPERRLVVLVCSHEGWRIVAPGSKHPGELKSSKTRLPIQAGEFLKFAPPYSPFYRFLFIEHNADFLHALPEAGELEPLSEWAINGLAIQLQDTLKSNVWRSAEATVVLQ